MIQKVRTLVFTNILSQQVGWFDNEEYTPITLTNSMAKDPPLIKSVRTFHLFLTRITFVLLDSNNQIFSQGCWDACWFYIGDFNNDNFLYCHHGVFKLETGPNCVLVPAHPFVLVLETSDIHLQAVSERVHFIE
jgi:hypothetical protein